MALGGLTKLISILLLLSITLNIYLLWPAPTEDEYDSSSPASEKSITKKTTAQIETPYQPINNLFKQQKFNTAVADYKQLMDSHPLQAKKLYATWLTEVNSWINDNKLILSEDFLHIFLSHFPYDVKMIQLDAERLVKSQQTHQAITALFSLKPLADETEQASVSMRLAQLTLAQIKSLSEQQAWQTLIDETTVWLDYASNNPDYLIAQANAYYQLGDLISAQSSLERLPQSHPNKAHANALQDSIDNAYTKVDHVPLIKRGAHYLLNIAVNTNQNTQLVIDTGASITVLPRSFINSLYPTPDYLGTIKVNTANGQTVARRYRVESIQVGQHVLTGFDVLAMSQNTGHGLLGMNFLQHFKFNINQQTNKLELVKQ